MQYGLSGIALFIKAGELRGNLGIISQPAIVRYRSLHPPG
jgi:hypothetical protein